MDYDDNDLDSDRSKKVESAKIPRVDIEPPAPPNP